MDSSNPACPNGCYRCRASSRRPSRCHRTRPSSCSRRVPEPRSSPCTPAWHRPWSRPRVCRPSAHRWHRARARESGKWRAFVKLHGNGPSDRPMWPKPSAANLMLGAALHSLVRALCASRGAPDRERHDRPPPAHGGFGVSVPNYRLDRGYKPRAVENGPLRPVCRRGSPRFTHPWPSALTEQPPPPMRQTFPAARSASGRPVPDKPRGRFRLAPGSLL